MSRNRRRFSPVILSIRNRIIPVIIHPGFLAVFLGLIIYIILPYRPEPYLFRLEQTEVNPVDPDNWVRYYARLGREDETNAFHL